MAASWDALRVASTLADGGGAAGGATGALARRCEAAAEACSWAAAGNPLPAPVVQALSACALHADAPPPLRVLGYEALWSVPHTDEEVWQNLAAVATTDINALESTDTTLAALRTLGALPSALLLRFVTTPEVERRVEACLDKDRDPGLRASAALTFGRVFLSGWAAAQGTDLSELTHESQAEQARARQDLLDRTIEVHKMIAGMAEDADATVCAAAFEALERVFVERRDGALSATDDAFAVHDGSASVEANDRWIHLSGASSGGGTGIDSSDTTTAATSLRALLAKLAKLVCPRFYRLAARCETLPLAQRAAGTRLLTELVDHMLSTPHGARGQLPTVRLEHLATPLELEVTEVSLQWARGTLLPLLSSPYAPTSTAAAWGLLRLARFPELASFRSAWASRVFWTLYSALRTDAHDDAGSVTTSVELLTAACDAMRGAALVAALPEALILIFGVTVHYVRAALSTRLIVAALREALLLPPASWATAATVEAAAIREGSTKSLLATLLGCPALTSVWIHGAAGETFRCEIVTAVAEALQALRPSFAVVPDRPSEDKAVESSPGDSRPLHDPVLSTHASARWCWEASRVVSAELECVSWVGAGTQMAADALLSLLAHLCRAAGSDGAQACLGDVNAVAFKKSVQQVLSQALGLVRRLAPRERGAFSAARPRGASDGIDGSSPAPRDALHRRFRLRMLWLLCAHWDGGASSGESDDAAARNIKSLLDALARELGDRGGQASEMDGSGGPSVALRVGRPLGASSAGSTGASRAAADMNVPHEWELRGQAVVMMMSVLGMRHASVVKDALSALDKLAMDAALPRPLRELAGRHVAILSLDRNGAAPAELARAASQATAPKWLGHLADLVVLCRRTEEGLQHKVAGVLARTSSGYAPALNAALDLPPAAESDRRQRGALEAHELYRRAVALAVQRFLLKFAASDNRLEDAGLGAGIVMGPRAASSAPQDESRSVVGAVSSDALEKVEVSSDAARLMKGFTCVNPVTLAESLRADGEAVTGGSDPFYCVLSHSVTRSGVSSGPVLVINVRATNVTRIAISGLRMSLHLEGQLRLIDESGSSSSAATHVVDGIIAAGSTVLWRVTCVPTGFGRCSARLRLYFEGAEDVQPAPAGEDGDAIVDFDQGDDNDDDDDIDWHADVTFADPTSCLTRGEPQSKPTSSGGGDTGAGDDAAADSAAADDGTWATGGVAAGFDDGGGAAAAGADVSLNDIDKPPPGAGVDSAGSWVRPVELCCEPYMVPPEQLLLPEAEVASGAAGVEASVGDLAADGTAIDGSDCVPVHVFRGAWSRMRHAHFVDSASEPIKAAAVPVVATDDLDGTLGVAAAPVDVFSSPPARVARDPFASMQGVDTPADLSAVVEDTADSADDDWLDLHFENADEDEGDDSDSKGDCGPQPSRVWLEACFQHKWRGCGLSAVALPGSRSVPGLVQLAFLGRTWAGQLVGIAVTAALTRHTDAALAREAAAAVGEAEAGYVVVGGDGDGDGDGDDADKDEDGKQGGESESKDDEKTGEAPDSDEAIWGIASLADAFANPVPGGGDGSAATCGAAAANEALQLRWDVRVEIRCESSSVLAALVGDFDGWFSRFCRGKLRVLRHYGDDSRRGAVAAVASDARALGMFWGSEPAPDLLGPDATRTARKAGASAALRSSPAATYMPGLRAVMSRWTALSGESK